MDDRANCTCDDIGEVETYSIEGRGKGVGGSVVRGVGRWVLSYSRNEQSCCYDSRTGATVRSRAKESAVVDEVGLQDAKRDAAGHV